MRLLLDTCTFLWWAQGSAQVPERVRTLIADPANQVWLSAVSSWEIAVKHAHVNPEARGGRAKYSRYGHLSFGSRTRDGSS